MKEHVGSHKGKKWAYKLLENILSYLPRRCIILKSDWSEGVA